MDQFNQAPERGSEGEGEEEEKKREIEGDKEKINQRQRWKRCRQPTKWKFHRRSWGVGSNGISLR